MDKKRKDCESVRGQLLKELLEGEYKKEDRLPPEAVLAEKMGVSRTLIRDSLSSLEREGFISRRQGIGTTINKHVLAVKARMDLEMEFLEMVRSAGAQPGVALTEINTLFCDEKIASRLGVAQQTPVFAVSRLITADGKKILHCTDYVSYQIIRDYTYQREDLEKPIFYFLEKFCNTDVYMDLTRVRPVLADARLAAIFEIAEGDPLLNLDEVGYDIDGNRVLWSDEHYVDAVLEHTILRKKI